MEVYGGILSPYVARVILTARHKGVKHKLTMPPGGLKTPEYLALNPLGKIPTIKDGSTVLYESSVIVDYLDAKYKKKRIVPASAKDAARARLIATVFAEYVQAPTLALFRQRDPATRDQKVVEEKLAEIGRGLDVIEKLLSGKTWAAGAKFTIADVYAVPCWFFVQAMLPQFGVAAPAGGRKKLAKYIAKIQKDKLTATIMNEMGEAMKSFRPGGR
ncbi:MAG: glutathione S-transferase family protein [Rhodospirillaceae bacterium]|nr:glutathione S-transferase family protein [Rhodospirillaceae bacterium]